MRRKKVLCALGAKIAGRPFNKPPKFVQSVFPSLAWTNQKKDDGETKMVLYLLNTLSKECLQNLKAKFQAAKIKAVTSNVLQDLCQPTRRINI